MIMGCGKCSGINAFVFLLIGVLFLLQDLGTWAFWGLSWYTVLFVWLGIAGLCMRSCAECRAVMGMKKK